MAMSPLTKKRMDEAWRLKNEENLSYAQIANKMNTSKSNVQRLINLKRQQLKEDELNKKDVQPEPQQQPQIQQPQSTPLPSQTPTSQQDNYSQTDDDILNILPQNNNHKLQKTTMEHVITELNNNYTPVVLQPPVQETKEEQKSSVIDKIKEHKFAIAILLIIIVFIGFVIWYINKKTKDKDNISYTPPEQPVESTTDKEVNMIKSNSYEWKGNSFTPIG